MENKSKYRLFFIFLFVFLLGVGVFIGLNVTYNRALYDDYLASEQKNDDDSNVEIYNAEPVNTKKYNIDLVYIDEYTLCGETIRKERTVYDTTLSDLKEEESQKQIAENMEYDILEQSNERLVYTRKLNQNCPNHFLIKLEDGKIIVYNVISESVKSKYQEIDISTDVIRPELMEELNIGIKANSYQDLNLIIEDIES